MSRRLPRVFLTCFGLALGALPSSMAAVAASSQISSPDGRIAVEFWLSGAGEPMYRVAREGQVVLRDSKLGLVRADADFSKGLKVVDASAVEPVEDRYEILTAKRRENIYQAQRQVFRLATSQGARLEIVFQVSDDGVAFRYRFPETSRELHQLSREVTSFAFPAEAKAWLQSMAVAKTGWQQTNPSYEEFYEMEVPVGTPSPLGAGWVYPALFRTGDTWVLLSESALGRTYCGTRLRTSPNGEYTVGFPDERERQGEGPAHPQATLPWSTPWRVVVIGSLPTVMESMLGVHLADPPAANAAAPGGTGAASWSWPLLGDPHTVFDVQKRFVDFAADMGWRYTLVDALWDQQIGYEKLRELVEYARTKNVQILVWYNSAGEWNTTPQTPRDKLLTAAGRQAEFQRLKEIGVAGLKVDFFGGDGQSVINYYHDLLQDSAPFGFRMNFHGATLPRGWQRTYPHLMTVEAVRGLEFRTFEQANEDRAAAHNVMLPFTRNVFDPMDYTPMVLDRINRIERQTTSGHELALAVVYTSGIQHYAEIPEGMAKAPEYVREFLRRVPAGWDDVRFLGGYPGRYVVLARRHGDSWWIGGISGETTARTVELDLRALERRGGGMLITDGPDGNLSFEHREVTLPADGKLKLTLAPRGGFVLELPE